jgi:hypothetical protein
MAIKDLNEAEQFAGLIQRIAADTGSHKRQNAAEAIPQLFELIRSALLDNPINTQSIILEQDPGYGLIGNPVVFTSVDYGTEVDIIIPGMLEITRGDDKGLYNQAAELEFDDTGYTSPLDTEWNSSDGWGDLSDIGDRVYGTWTDAHGGDPLGMIGVEQVMRETITGRYFKIKILSWTDGANGGGFSYERQEVEITVPSTITFPDGSVLDSALGLGGSTPAASLRLRQHPTKQNVIFWRTPESTLQEQHFKGLSNYGPPYIKLDNGNLALMYYVMFIMPDGTLIFEAYDDEEDSADPVYGINGYWVAMKEVEGELVKVSELPMTRIMWDWWFDWTVPNYDDNTISLVRAGTVFNSTRTPDYSRIVISYSDLAGLTLVSEVYTQLPDTVGELMLHYHGTPNVSYNTTRAEPEYMADNSYFQMATGTNAGFVWFGKFGDTTKLVGFNVLTDEIRSFDLSTSPEFAGITNLTGNPLLSPNNFWSLGETGLTYQIGDGGIVDNHTANGLTGIWSPFTPDTTKMTWLRTRWGEGLNSTYVHTEGVFQNQFRNLWTGGGYFIDIQIMNDGRTENGQVAKLTRHKIGVDNDPEISYLILPKTFEGTFSEFWAGAFRLAAFPTNNGGIFAKWYNYRGSGQAGEYVLLYWSDAKAKAEILHSSQVYPSHFVGSDIIGKDIISLSFRNSMSYPVLIETFNTQF